MANHEILITDVLPDSSGSVTPEPHAVNFGVNDRWPSMVWKFGDTSTRLALGFKFRVPLNYVGTPVFIPIWSATITTGNVRWEIDYRAIAAGESYDPSTDQENLVVTSGAPATARFVVEPTMAATAANLAAGDNVIGALFRDGADAANDTMASPAYLIGFILKYADA